VKISKLRPQGESRKICQGLLGFGSSVSNWVSGAVKNGMMLTYGWLVVRNIGNVPYIGNYHPNCRAYFLGGLKPPTNQLEWDDVNIFFYELPGSLIRRDHNGTWKESTIVNNDNKQKPKAH